MVFSFGKVFFLSQSNFLTSKAYTPINIWQLFNGEQNWLRKIWKLFKRVPLSRGNYINVKWLSYFPPKTFLRKKLFIFFCFFQSRLLINIYVDIWVTATTMKLLKSSCIIKREMYYVQEYFRSLFSAPQKFLAGYIFIFYLGWFLEKI